MTALPPRVARLREEWSGRCDPRGGRGALYAVTSEPQALASRAQEDWALPFACVGDPHQEIAGTARERGWLELRTQEAGEFLTRHTVWEVTHPKGFFQPGVLALDSDQRLLYRWRSIPTRQNAGGATGRPAPGHVWERIREALSAPSSQDAAPDEAPRLDGKPTPFALFAALLMANGWFLRPKPFAYQGDGKDPIRERVPIALLRLMAFAALWIVAFALLPGVWVAAALALYLPVGIRGIRSVYTTFQHETS